MRKELGGKPREIRSRRAPRLETTVKNGGAVDRRRPRTPGVTGPAARTVMGLPFASGNTSMIGTAVGLLSISPMSPVARTQARDGRSAKIAGKLFIREEMAHHGVFCAQAAIFLFFCKTKPQRVFGDGIESSRGIRNRVSR